LTQSESLCVFAPGELGSPELARNTNADSVVLISRPRIESTGKAGLQLKSNAKPASQERLAIRQKRIGQWIERQLSTAPTLTDQRWAKIARIISARPPQRGQGRSVPPSSAQA
jgi:hypothetical protein